ncbi:cilia- and flagella-associated protein HOATZ-like isoform X2 [Pocillopora verrucosa]|uniref:cilia- and flagella-associated protein HOATZ-like isoform X2 n=1 Tax=Pocillopora verrucosa TaxID=203993 RepID=UPI00333FC715
MADVSTVSFSGSSAETIEKAKAFWKCIDPPPEQKSTLAVSGINHRLKTAPQVGDGKRLIGTHQTLTTSLEMENDPRLATYLEDAQKRKEQEQADYVQKITSFREEAQQMLAKRKVERLKSA